MQTVSNEFEQAQLENVVGKHFAYLYFYKRWSGRVISISNEYGDCVITIDGDARNFFSIGDVIVASFDNLNTEHIVITVIYKSTSYTTEILIWGATLYTNLPGKDYIYKKFEATEYVLDNGIGDIRKNFEDNDFGNLRPFQLNLSLIDDGSEFKLSGTKLNPGFFFRDSIVTQISGVATTGSLTKIQLEETIRDIWDYRVILESNIKFIDGGAKGAEEKIVVVNTIEKAVYIKDIDYADVLSVGDTVAIQIQSKYLVKLIFGLKNHLENDKMNVFFGVLYSKNIVQANKRIDLICYSLIKDFDEEYAFQVSNVSNKLSKIPGIIVIDYDVGNNLAVKERLVGVKYDFPAGNLQSVTGIDIVEISSNTGTISRLLRFRKKDWFQWSGGSWTQISIDSEATTLTASDGSYIKVDSRIADYAATDAEDLVFINAKSKMDLSELSRGPAGLIIDGGDVQQLFSKFFRIWVDISYVAGTIGNDVDINDVVNDTPIEIISTTVGSWAVYIGLTQKFGGFRIKGLRQKGVSLSNLVWEYSLPFGNDPNCFTPLTVVDGTSGFSKDGTVTWVIPDDWGKKAKVGVGTDFHMYWIRIRSTVAVITKREVDTVSPIIICIGKDGDVFSLESDYTQLNSDDLEDDLIIKLNEDGTDYELAVWKQCVRVVDLYTQLIEKSGYSVNFQQLETGLIDWNSKVLNVWGKPFSAEKRMPSAMCVGEGECEGYIFACFNNAIYRLKGYEYEWELLFACDINYKLHAIYYYDHVFEELPGYKYYLLAVGFGNVTPSGSLDGEDYRIQPKQILLRIDNPHTDDYYVTVDYIDDGGKINDVTPYSTGDGLIDNKFLFRGGMTTTDEQVAIRNLIGSSDYFLWVGSGLNYAFRAENIAIFYSQLVIRLLTLVSIASAGEDIDYDKIGIFDFPVTTHVAVPDVVLPVTVDPGYYRVYVLADYPPHDDIRDLAFRYSLGQDGGFCKIYFPLLSDVFPLHITGIYGQKPDPNAVDWTHRCRTFIYQGLGYYGGSNPNSMQCSNNLGYGLEFSAVHNGPDGSTLYFFARTELLCANQMKYEDWSEKDYILQGVYLDYYIGVLHGDPEPTQKEIVNEKRIEAITARNKTRSHRLNTTQLVIWHYDYSTTTWAEKDADVSFTVRENDEIIIADNRKFSEIYLETSNLLNSPVTITCYQSNGSGGWWTVYDNTYTIYSTNHSNNQLLEFAMHRFWLIDDGAGGNVNDMFIYRIVIDDNPAGDWGFDVDHISIFRREIWSNLDSYYISGTDMLYDYVPLELICNATDGHLYGCLANQLDLTYHIFCLKNLETRLLSSDIGFNYMETVQLSSFTGGDSEMQPKGFVVNEIDGYVYFVACDMKYQRKAAQLWRGKYNNLTGIIDCEKLTDIVYGEWDCPTKLCYSDNKIYGFTGPNKGYFWEWSDKFYIRIPIANFGSKTVKESLMDVGQLMNVITLVDEEAVTIMRKRLDDRPTMDKEWNSQQIVNIPFIRESEGQADGVVINWDDGEHSGFLEFGSTGLGNDIISVDNQLIMFHHIAYIVGMILWNFYVKRRRELEGTSIFLYQHQLFDVIKIQFSLLKYENQLDDFLLWQIKSMIVSWKRKNINFILLENKNEERQVS